MKIKVNNQEHEIATNPGDHLKVYQVPSNYSDDGIFIARWQSGTIEPFPGCLGKDAQILADVIVSETGANGWMNGVEVYA